MDQENVSAVVPAKRGEESPGWDSTAPWKPTSLPTV